MDRATISKMDSKTIGATLFAIAVSAGISYLMATELRPAGTGSSTNERLHDLEVSNQTIAETLERRGSAARVGEKAIAERLGVLSAQLTVAGIIDDKEEPVRRWWCTAIECARTRPDCDLGIARFRARHQYDSKFKNDSLSCEPMRIAFCSASSCERDLGACILMAADPATCRGVE